MVLQVRFVQDLREIVEPVAEYLNRDIATLDLFETQHVIVPTAGVRAWLVPQLARHLGARPGVGDGIVSNVKFGYVGSLNAFLRNGVEDDGDAWSIDHLTMAVLRVLSEGNEYEWLVTKYGGALRAARSIADRFDRYAARRPQMIRAWERDSMMIPGVNVADAEATTRFRWQFDLWKRVRDIIGVPSWPARSEALIAQLHEGNPIDGLPNRLMVAGLESISASNLEVLIALGRVIDVEAHFVHPSPALREEWSRFEGNYRSEGADAPQRDEEFVTPNIDVLVSTWMRGSFELQMLLASQGISATHVETGFETRTDICTPSSDVEAPLLAMMRYTIADPTSKLGPAAPTRDLSVQVHRAHNLARQVEVLHDALLHAFTDIPDLQPHEVVVLCADIESAAPLLQATFDRTVSLANGNSVKFPFVVADRSLRDVSAGAELLDDVLALARSRFDVNSLIKVAATPLVLENFRLDDGDVSVWMRFVELTRVRWGLDIEQRAVKGLDTPKISAHSWQHALERALLGALVPDGPAAVEMGDVVPLTHVEVADIVPISGLVGILSPLVELERESRTAHSVAEWCDVLERTLIALCGESCIGVDDALDVLSQFRRATVLTHTSEHVEFVDPVNFDEFADLVGKLITTVPGQQPLRTGAITATSFVPVRSVPFRVVCVVGLDDGTLPNGDTEGDDLVALEALMGDPDPRLETRRVLLDAVLAAHDRLIVTCVGRSIKNNAAVPLVTPLAELVDFSVRLGASAPSPDDPYQLSGIEILHPRHPSGERNFVDTDDAVVPGIVWSHDVAARTAAEHLSRVVDASPAPAVSMADTAKTVSLRSLEALVIDPLKYYLERRLRIYDEYDDLDLSATLPTDPEKFGVSNAAEALDEMLDANSLEEVEDQWRTAMYSSEILPVDPFVEDYLVEARDVALSVHEKRLGNDLSGARSEVVQLDLGDGITVEGEINGICDSAEVLSLVQYRHSWENDLTRIALRLVVLRAMGSTISRGIMIHRVKDSTNASVRTLTLDASITSQSAKDALRALLDSEMIARTVPCPHFGGTSLALFGPTPDSDAAADAFESAVEAYEFKRTKEYMVYGGNPTISEVYETRREMLGTFFGALFGLMTVESTGPRTNAWVVTQ